MERKRLKILALCAVLAFAAGGALAQESKLTIGGTTYTKWLWGTQRYGGSLYSFTTVPGEGFGDNGQGSEIELLLSAKLSRQVEVRGRIHSRFNQNQWTNFGGFGGRNPAFEDPPGPPCTGGDCGEYDPRSNQYVKLRGVTVILTPGYSWIDSATIGASDFGMFDPFVIGRIRYIDRDNASGLLFQGSAMDRRFRWDFTRISLPRLWAGPNFSTGVYTQSDAAYGLQFAFSPSSNFDIGLIGEYVNDIEVDSEDFDLDDGRDIRTRFRNSVVGAKIAFRPGVFDIRAAYYDSSADSNPNPAPGGPNWNVPTGFGTAGFSPVPAGRKSGESWKANVDINDPFGIGLSILTEVFHLGADYVSMMAARRESDVLLTEGFDSSFAFPGPANAAFGVFGGNPTRIGYGGWGSGNAHQVATINVDNEFTDFDEPMAETAIGWEGATVVLALGRGALDLQLEGTFLDYDTNWQAWGDPTRAITDSDYPNHEGDTGVGHNYRTAYAPFQDKETKIYVLRAKYVLDVGRGVDLWGKIKHIDETDNRMTDPRFLPFQPGDCPGGGVACAGVVNNYFDDGVNAFSTAAIYGNPGVITVGAQTGYQWKPFDSVTDDDRDLDYWAYTVGAGYQLSDDLYGSLQYDLYDADLFDGTTAFQAYNLHEMAGGKHSKNRATAKFRYILAGAELGLQYEWIWGDFEPDFGGGFVPQIAGPAEQANVGVPIGSPGFAGRFGGWNPLYTQEFDQQRLKAFMKVQF